MLDHKGYRLPMFRRYDGLGRFYYTEGVLYNTNSDLDDWLDDRFDRCGLGWKMPRPSTFAPEPMDSICIIGKGISSINATGDLLVGINHFPIAEGSSVRIMQDFQPIIHDSNRLTIISDELIPLFDNHLFPDAGPVAVIPRELQGKVPTAVVACQLFDPVTSNLKLVGFDGVYAEDAPEHYKMQRPFLDQYRQYRS